VIPHESIAITVAPSSANTEHLPSEVRLMMSKQLMDKET
jgi:hypothetical protein